MSAIEASDSKVHEIMWLQTSEQGIRDGCCIEVDDGQMCRRPDSVIVFGA